MCISVFIKVSINKTTNYHGKPSLQPRVQTCTRYWNIWKLHLSKNLKQIIYYLTVAIVRPAEPAHDGRAHPGEGPGQGPEKWPIRERLCHGEVGEARWEDSTVPGILDGDIHGEILKKM